MVDDMRRRLVRRLPGVGWREARLHERAREVAELREQLKAARAREKELAAALGRAESTSRKAPHATELPTPLPASFRRQLWDLRRALMTLRRMDPERLHPQWQLTLKLRSYRLAASHGVSTPRVLGSWLDAEDVDVSSLPEEFVLKADRGHSSLGVLPLRRTGSDAYELLDGSRRYSRADLAPALTSKPGLEGPFFAEEVLVQPEGGPIPDDVKIYCAYGHVLHVMLRRMPRHGNLAHARYRYVDHAGRDLGDVAPQQRIDDTIPLPSSLADMVEAAQHLSRAAGVPFCRVDLYDTDRGVVLGEITQAPGGAQLFSAAHDRWMGVMWDHGRWQLDLDILSGRPPGVLHGSHPAPNPYPDGHVSRAADPGTWAVRQVPCEEWCVGSPTDHGHPRA